MTELKYLGTATLALRLGDVRRRAMAPSARRRSTR
jgi:hypothetical protein